VFIGHTYDYFLNTIGFIFYLRKIYNNSTISPLLEVVMQVETVEVPPGVARADGLLQVYQVMK